MKSLVGIALLVFTIIGTVKSDCYDPVTQHTWKNGEDYTPLGHCVKLICSESANEHSGITCGLLRAPPGCDMILEDLTKPYPECCSRFECPTKYVEHPEKDQLL